MIRVRISVLVMACMFPGSVFSQTKPSSEPVPPSAQEKNEAPKAIPEALPANPAPVDKNYEIGPEDILYLKVWRENEFTGQLAVRPDGKITLPLVGDVQAAGLTPDALATQLKQSLSEIIIKPEVTVMVLQVNSKKYFMAGEINRPGQYPLVVATRIFDALSNAGGFRDFANKKDIVIVRHNDRLKFNYEQYIRKSNKADQNILLENGDTIIVK